LIGYTDSD
jgi:hypothetical protein